MLLWQCTAFALQLLSVVCHEDVAGPLVRIASPLSLRPALQLRTVLDIVTSSESCIIGVDISVVEGKQLTKSLVRAYGRDETQMTVDVELSTQSLWKTYRRGWRLQLCAVLLMEDDTSASPSNSGDHQHVNDQLVESDWRQTLSHDELLETSLSFDCHVIGTVTRRDMFSWNWVAVLRENMEMTCHSGNGGMMG